METTKITRCNIGKQVGFAWEASSVTSYVRLIGGITIEMLTEDLKMFDETIKSIDNILTDMWAKQILN